MMKTPAGATMWMIPDCYWPETTGPDAPYPSHEAICVLNAGDADAHLSITFYFEDRDPVCAQAMCAARRTHHVRLDRLDTEAGPLPRGVAYAALVCSDVPVVVQYSRCDANPSLALMSTLAYPLQG